MDRYTCKDCGVTANEDEIILTVNSEGEWVLHCPKCNSDLLSLAYELQT